jgi:LysM repeat protein
MTMTPLLKIIPFLSILLWFGCARVEKEVKSIQEGFVKGYDETKKALTPEDSKPKQAAKAAEAPPKPPEPVKPKEFPSPPSPPPQPAAPKDLPPVPPPAKTPVPDEFILHRVLSGETLATIAKWYNGKSTAWKAIATHNPGVQPFRLKVGQQIKVPRSLAVAHQEQPDFSTATGPPAGTPPPPESGTSDGSKPSSSKPIFGPK